MMETQPCPCSDPFLADDFPRLYRAALEAAADLERRGLRREAARLRREAAQAYSVWDEQSRRRLVALVDGARRSSEALDRASRARERVGGRAMAGR